MNDNQLWSLTGLTSEVLADVLRKNPRAYMAVKGAVAEKHLELVLERYVEQGLITSFRAASSDFEKDFYVTTPNGQELSIECKNIQVLSVDNKKNGPRYLQYLVDEGMIPEDSIRRYIESIIASEFEGEILDVLNSALTANQLTELIVRVSGEAAPSELSNKAKKLAYIVEETSPHDIVIEEARKLKYGPRKTSIVRLLEGFIGKQVKAVFSQIGQEFRESGMPRYKFSASLLKETTVNSCPIEFLAQFDDDTLSIDFQRTRNSTDQDGDTRRNRLYEVGEVDIVAGCLFSRTLSWDFIFARANSFAPHDKFRDRYSNSLKILKEDWSGSLEDTL